MRLVKKYPTDKFKEFRVYTRSKIKCVELLNKGFQYDYICGSLYRLSRKF